jgi:beta-lactamase superfamily II metal-dependent hydrolase
MKFARLAAVLCAGAIAATAAQAAEKPLRLLMMDADGGAAALFVTPEGKSMLVDTGWPAGMPPGRPPADGTAAPPPPAATVDRIAAGMKKLGLKKIDYVLVTHYHVDHVGGIHDILARVPVGAFIDHGENREQLTPQQAASPSSSHPAILYPKYLAAIAGKKRHIVKAGDTINIGSMKLTFVASDGSFIGRPLPGAGGRTPKCDVPAKPWGPDENNRSIGFVATYGKARILDLADLTWDEEKQLVCPVNKIGPIDVLLVSHHGSELSNSPPLIAATTPRVALVANGARKGGDKSGFETLKAATSKPAIWYQHFATRAPEANPEPNHIANRTLQPDGAFDLDVLISKNGAVRVVNGRNGYAESYPPR